MKVERVIGWLKGISGIGNIFEVSHDQGYFLAMIWSDGKFHYLNIADLKKQIQEGTAAVAPSAMRERYLPVVPENDDGSLPVENPDGWQRLYTPSDQSEGSGGEQVETRQTIELPFKFEGKLTIDVSQLAELIKLID